MSIYDYILETGEGRVFKLDEWKGKVILIVNTATGCGFTPQYKDWYYVKKMDKLNREFVHLVNLVP